MFLIVRRQSWLTHHLRSLAYQQLFTRKHLRYVFMMKHLRTVFTSKHLKNVPQSCRPSIMAHILLVVRPTIIVELLTIGLNGLMSLAMFVPPLSVHSKCSCMYTNVHRFLWHNHYPNSPESSFSKTGRNDRDQKRIFMIMYLIWEDI